MSNVKQSKKEFFVKLIYRQKMFYFNQSCSHILTMAALLISYLQYASLKHPVYLL